MSAVSSVSSNTDMNTHTYKDTKTQLYLKKNSKDWRHLKTDLIPLVVFYGYSTLFMGYGDGVTVDWLF